MTTEGKDHNEKGETPSDLAFFVVVPLGLEPRTY